MSVRFRLPVVMAGIAAVFALCVAAGIAWNWAPDRPLQDLTQQWAPPPSRFIDVNGLSVHIRDEGVADDPVPVLLIHGTSSSLHTWEGWVSILKKDRRVISMDLPGFGLTGPNAEQDYSNAAYTRFMLDLMDQLHIRKAVLAGNSLGGEIAWNVAVAAPQRVDKLILVDAAGYAFKPISIPAGFQIARIPILSWFMDHTLPASMLEESVKDVYGNPEKVSPALLARYRAMTVRAGNRAALRKRIRTLNLGENAADIQRIHVPTLILWGGKDKLIPPENAAWFARDIAQSKLIMFDELGHVPQEEAPFVTAAAARIFLARDTR